ncbi:folate family ECF transporter S component [Clostridium felsineum]|uniref:Uncharacterized protein n=1 Tax=Clostridium felsineum TaxID=36839 RepID=A0A1S8MCF2_9CLOT|nr:folate family ECF transporter S component [Clostridium felsineum]MCR3761238.1 folate family ECF transporter S component [Clostridium felsineum]URZ00047.1 hypothetical protein CLAUR_000300 [Clostridium felsineum]URZ07308.1 hypothetical protein CLROS_026460 [Clostridium felsineum]URZ12339.1 hypothetical protein CROST_030610 [Clostridium felsineum]
MNKTNTKFLVTTALFIAISIIIKTFGISITGGGIVIMKINFSAVFYILPGILFGPLYGAIAGGSCDLLGFLINPTGSYIPIFTLTNILAGFLPAVLWKKVKLTSTSKLKKLYISFFVSLLILGIIFNFILKINILNSLFKPSNTFSNTNVNIIYASLIGILVFIINSIIEKTLKKTYGYLLKDFFKIFISVGFSGIIVSTLNTIFMLIFTPALLKNGFAILWFPRIVQTIIMTMINSYILSFLIYLYSFVDKKSLSRA